VRIPLGTTDFSRSAGGMPDIDLINRYFEIDPTNQDDQVALLSRPALQMFWQAGDGPIRQVYSQPGTFGDALFFVSGDTVFKLKPDFTQTTIGTLGTTDANVSMTATPTYQFIADGDALYYYTENDYARGTLTATGAIVNGDKVVVGTVTYQFTSGDVDTGTPLGTAGAPWLVALGATTQISLENLFDAIAATGEAGTTYSTALEANLDVAVVSSDATTLVIRAAEAGTGGNTVVTTETGANIAWGAATLANGGGTVFDEVDVPDGDGIISVGFIAQFVICVVSQGQGKNGRYYWIEPGEIIIDPLNYATAEKAPDPVWQVVVSGDKFWLPGSSSIEVWYPAGDPLAPFLRQQGILFEARHLAGHDPRPQGNDAVRRQ
jgi:hypothetical protein